MDLTYEKKILRKTKYYLEEKKNKYYLEEKKKFTH
jgi:hypothetical protein